MTQTDELKIFAAVNAGFPAFTALLKEQLQDKIRYLILAQDDTAMRLAQGEARTLKALIDRLESAKDSLERSSASAVRR